MMSDSYNKVFDFLSYPFDSYIDSNQNCQNIVEHDMGMGIIVDDNLFLNDQLDSSISSVPSTYCKVSLKCAREKDNCYSYDFPEFLFKKPHKYDLKMIGRINHKELTINLCSEGESTPIYEDPSKAITTELCVVNENECIVRFCLLVCSHSLSGKSLELIACVDGNEIFRSNSFKCLARKRARHNPKAKGLEWEIAENKPIVQKQKKLNTTSSNKKRKRDSLSSPSDSVISPSSPKTTSIKRVRLDDVESNSTLSIDSPSSPSNSNHALDSASSSPNHVTCNIFNSTNMKDDATSHSEESTIPSSNITWNLFQLICNMNSSHIEQEGGNSRIHLAINLLNSLQPEERNSVLQYYYNRS